MKTIEIDWEIHQAIEAERHDFDEPPYVALRRLLKLPPPRTIDTDVQVREIGLPWSEEGVVVPHGSDARMEYLRGKQVYEGKFLNGKLVVNGRAFNTLSSAASALATTRDGGQTSLNGWLYWKVRFPGETEWRSLDKMRHALIENALP